MSNTGPGLPWYLRDPGAHHFSSGQVLTLDLETTNVEYGDSRLPANRIVLGTLKHGAGPSRTYMGQEDVLQALACIDEPTILVAHNAKFELGWMLRLGLDISHFLPWDTMIAEYVIAGNRRVPLDLGSVSTRRGFRGKDPVVDLLIEGGVCPSIIPEHWLRARCERDVQTTHQVYRAQNVELLGTKLLNVLFTRCIVTPVLAAIEREGMTLDKGRVYKEYDRVVRARGEVEQKLVQLTGGVNTRSTKQLGEYLYGKLGFAELRDRMGRPRRTKASKAHPEGQRLTDADTLEALVATNPAQKQFKKLRSEFSKLDAALSKSLRFFNGVCEEHDGTFYGNFNQCVTQTHRLSSSGRRITLRDKHECGAQFQNLPREYKRLFRHRDQDTVLVEPDGSQLEFRVAAFLGQDKVACADIVAEADIHRFTASVLHRCPEDQVTKAQRTNAKASTFKPLYGGMSGTAREVAYYESFREKYKAIYDTQMEWVHKAMKTQQLETPWGLVFYYPGTEMTRSGYITNTPNIFNYSIQSLATADIIPVSLVYTYWAMRAEGIRGRIFNTIHDSLIAEIHRNDVDKFRKVVLSCFLARTYEFLSRVYGIEMNVPLGVWFTVGSHWGEGEEEKHSAPYKTILSDS